MALTISVVIPVYNAAGHLRRCLEALSHSHTPPTECIVVDDGSTDDSGAVAFECGATVIRCEHLGPARARNLGAKAATGDILLFCDADVRVHEDTIARILSNLAADSDLDAVIGCYDDSPASPGLVAQYRNLRQCFVHRRARRQAFTFWTGCGAIRRNVFLAFGGFDEDYLRPSIEDIELGYRLSRANRKTILDKSVLVKHLKHWTLWSLLTTDILDRGIPWTELILKHRSIPNDLNLRVRERAAVVLAFLLCAWIILGTVRHGGLFPAPLFALPAVAAPIHGMKVRRPRRSLAGAARLPAHAIYLLSALPLFMVPGSPAVFALATYLTLLALVAADGDFYEFVESGIGPGGALAIIPLHLLYHFYSGISFAVGLSRFLWRTLSKAYRAASPDPIPFRLTLAHKPGALRSPDQGGGNGL